MEISIKEAMDAVLNSDVDSVAEILEDFGFYKNNPSLCTDGSRTQIVSFILSAASIKAFRDDFDYRLDEELANELIERTAMIINIYPFIYLVAAASYEAEKSANFDLILEDIRTAITNNAYRYGIARAIEKLKGDTLKALLVFIRDDEFNGLDTKFNLPITRAIYNEGLVSDDIFFALMEACLVEL